MRGSSSSRPDYPLALISAYGPDSSRATKLVVALVRRSGEDPSELRTWTADAGDVRTDHRTDAEVADWLSDRGIKNSQSFDRIIGCPHEEGIDYPLGRTCPQCPFWAGIDRFTHEPIPAPVARMSPEQVLIELSKDRDTHPREALESADAHRAVLLPALSQLMDRCLTEPAAASDEEALLFCYALYLMAKWRETRAYPLVVRWFLLREEDSDFLSGDMLTQDGGRILAAVCDGDLEPIKRVIVNRDAGEFSRSVAISALALLAAWAETPRAAVVDYFGWLAREGLERQSNHVWSGLATESADLEALSVFPELRRAFDEGLIDRMAVGRSELDDVEASPRGALIEEMKDRHPPIDDVAEATSWWECFSERRSGRASDLAALAASDVAYEERREPYRAPVKTGRNDPCPCGSGKKYKKCCGGIAN
jgi:hypothetical protein